MESALILLENGYDELELWLPYDRFLEHGLTARLVGPKAGETYAGKRGLPARADLSFGDASLESARILLVPGGWAPNRIRVHEAAIALVRWAFDRGSVVAAICHGGSVLVSADLIRGRRVTSTRSIRDDLRAAGAMWVDEPVVVDRPLVASRTPADLPHFLPAILLAAAT
jgi:protease I